MAICGKKCAVYARIVGFYEPIQQWNKGKLAEYHDRKMYKLDKPLMKKFEGKNG